MEATVTAEILLRHKVAVRFTRCCNKGLPHSDWRVHGSVLTEPAPGYSTPREPPTCSCDFAIRDFAPARLVVSHFVHSGTTVHDDDSDG